MVPAAGGGELLPDVVDVDVGAAGAVVVEPGVCTVSPLSQTSSGRTEEISRRIRSQATRPPMAAERAATRTESCWTRDASTGAGVVAEGGSCAIASLSPRRVALRS